MAKSVFPFIHARNLESVVVMMNAVISMVAMKIMMVVEQSFTLEDRSVTQIQIVFAILNAIHF